MSDSRDDPEVYWVEPRERAIIPLEEFRCSRSLAKVIRQDRFAVTLNRDFPAVVDACAAPRPGHPESWISHRIAASYHALHLAGHAHSVECWLDGELVGGLYGVSFERVFCGESMFSRATDASKVALAWLVALMRMAGFQLLDCQFMTGHLASLGAESISLEHYRSLLAGAIASGDARPLSEVYSEVVSAGAATAGAGSAGAGSATGALGALGAERPGASSLSSPGKLIAQSFTQTS